MMRNACRTTNDTTLTRSKAAFLDGPEPTKGGQWTCDVTFEELREQVGISFAGNEKRSGEPTMDWLFERSISSLPSLDFKVEVFTFVMSAFFISELLAKKGVAFCKKTEQGDIATTIVIREYDPAKEPNWWTKLGDNFRNARLAIGALIEGKLPEFFTNQKFKDDLQHFVKLTDQLAGVNAWRNEFGPKHKHWYIGIVATSPDCQGQGEGSEIMRRVVELADAEKMDCYLECGESNVRFYEKFGYRMVGTKTVQDKENPGVHDTHDLHLMVRPRGSK